MNQQGSLPGGMYKYTNAGKLPRYISALSEESTSPIEGQRRYSCCITYLHPSPSPWAVVRCAVAAPMYICCILWGFLPKYSVFFWFYRCLYLVNTNICKRRKRQNTYAKAVLLLGSSMPLIRQLKDIFEVVVHLCMKILQRAAILRCKYYALISSEGSKDMKYKKDISHISPLDSHLFFETLSQVIFIDFK